MSRKSKLSEDPYKDVDLAQASRFAGRGWVLTGAIGLGFMPFFPPTDAIGDAGWIVAPGAMVLLGGAVAATLVRSASGLRLLVASLIGVGIITLLQWLAGAEAPYGHLYLLVVISASLLQPPPRLALVLVTVTAIHFLPQLYDPDAFRAGDAAMESLLWIGFGVFLSMVMRQLRAQRAELQLYTKEAELSARSDPLTGLFNRRAFEEDITLELERRSRTGQPLSLAVFDLDGFKQINDELGHQVGDDVLRLVAEAMRAETRAVDGCYRWGGDEFAVVLPGSGLGASKVVGRRIAERLERQSPLPGAAPVRISIGAAEFGDQTTVEEAVAAADGDLMTVKRLRRENRVG